jgi:hypothetical protein
MTSPVDWSIEQVKAFQRLHFNHLGLPLLVDGIPGPETQWALALETIHPLRKEICLRACASVDQVEEFPSGSNRNPWIDMVNRRCGVPVGSRWCASAASFWISVEGVSEVKQASVIGLSRALVRVTEPQPGDVWVILKNGVSHCGVPIGFGPGEVMSVEGNENNGVHVTLRGHSEITSFHRTVPAAQFPGILTKRVNRHAGSVI